MVSDVTQSPSFSSCLKYETLCGVASNFTSWLRPPPMTRSMARLDGGLRVMLKTPFGLIHESKQTSCE